MKLNTVNIIEYANDAVLGVTSFEDTPKGNKEAEKLFTALVLEYEAHAIHTSSTTILTKKEIKEFIEDGIFEQGTYQVFIAHSN